MSIPQPDGGSVPGARARAGSAGGRSAGPAIVSPTAGVERRWEGTSLVRVQLTSAQTGGALGLARLFATAGAVGPRHTHTREDELFVVLDGQVTLVAGDVERSAEAGTAAFLPRGIPHSYLVGPAGADMLILVTPGGFEQFFIDAGFPLEGNDPGAVDEATLRTHAIDVATGLGLGLTYD